MSSQPSDSHHEFNFAHHAAFVRRNQHIRGLILDYALGIAIVGLNPIPNTLWLTLLIALVLIIKMSWDVGKKWRFAKVYDPLAYLGLLFGGAGSLTMSIMVCLIFFLLGRLLPLLNFFMLSAILFTFTWTWGQTLHHFFANGFPKRTQYHATQELPSAKDMDS